MSDENRAMRLDIDDMTALRITVGRGPKGWVLDMSAIGQGALGVGMTPTQIAFAVGSKLDEYFGRMAVILAEQEGTEP